MERWSTDRLLVAGVPVRQVQYAETDFQPVPLAAACSANPRQAFWVGVLHTDELDDVIRQTIFAQIAALPPQSAPVARRVADDRKRARAQDHLWVSAGAPAVPG